MTLNLALRLGAITPAAASLLDPSTISNLSLWYDAADVSSFTFSSGSAVSQWNDKSGNGLNLTQATVAEQPGRTGTQNGRSTVVFDGGDWMTKSAGVVFSAPLTCFVVFKPTATGTNRLITADGNGWGIANEATSGFWATVRAGVAYQYQSTGALTAGTWRQIATDVTSTSSTTGYLDGATDGTDTYSAFTYTGGSVTIGAGSSSGSGKSPAGTEIAEILCYSRSLNSTERNSVFDYLRTKWGVA